jgi:dihydroorotate dehydrogenase (NAD+) catalytic subunit
MSKKPDLKVNLGAIELQNPVMTASGTFGYAREFEGLVDLNRLGAIIVKGLSLEPTKGNPPPRIVETPCGMLNAIGLENVGIDVFVKEKLPFLQTLFPPIFVNIYGTTIKEYAELAARVDELEAISGVEVNISCPNVKAGGIAFGADQPIRFLLSTPLPLWPSILKPGIRRSPTSPVASRVPPSSRLLCEWCGRWRKRQKSRLSVSGVS